MTQNRVFLMLHFPVVLKMRGLGFSPLATEQPYGDNSGIHSCPRIISISPLHSLECFGFDGKLDYSEQKSEVLETNGNLSKKAPM